ncbi:MAG: 50S ribosomal protein L30e [Candidatus Bathycorpusculaceae bacterium]
MIDVDKAIATAVKTGKVSFGANPALQNAKTGKAKMIILAANCPATIRGDIEYYCKLSKIPLITYKGSSMDLASLCGKPFTISALSIREPGDSEILELLKGAESEETHGGNE